MWTTTTFALVLGHAEIAVKLSMSRSGVMDRLASAERIVDAMLSDEPRNFHEGA